MSRIQLQRSISSGSVYSASLSTRNFPVSTAACLPVKKAAVKILPPLSEKKRTLHFFSSHTRKSLTRFFLLYGIFRFSMSVYRAKGSISLHSTSVHSTSVHNTSVRGIPAVFLILFSGLLCRKSTDDAPDIFTSIIKSPASMLRCRPGCAPSSR